MRKQGEAGVIRPFVGRSPEWSWWVARVDLSRVPLSFVCHTCSLPPNTESSPSGYRSHTNGTTVRWWSIGSVPGKAEAWWMDSLPPKHKAFCKLPSGGLRDIVALPLILRKPLFHPQVWETEVQGYPSWWVRSYKGPQWGLCGFEPSPWC